MFAFPPAPSYSSHSTDKDFYMTHPHPKRCPATFRPNLVLCMTLGYDSIMHMRQDHVLAKLDTHTLQMIRSQALFTPPKRTHLGVCPRKVQHSPGGSTCVKHSSPPLEPCPKTPPHEKSCSHIASTSLLFESVLDACVACCHTPTSYNSKYHGGKSLPTPYVRAWRPTSV